jgi:adenosylhomocysteine nucleosidase
VCAAPIGWQRAGALRWEGRLPHGGTCVVLQTGVGPARAGDAAETAPKARAMLVCGCAGGLVPELAAGSVVVADSVCDLATADRFPLRSMLIPESVRGLGLTLATGRIATAAAVLGSPAAKREAAAAGAIAVDMESAAVARVAAARNVPLAVLRVVVDTVDDALPPAALIDAASGKVRLGAAVAHFLPPGRWPAAMRMAARQRIADRALRAVSRAVLSRPAAG